MTDYRLTNIYLSGSNEEEAGRYQAEYILNKYSNQDTINVAIFKGEKTHSATLGRTNALKKTLNDSGKKINYVFEDNADWSTETAEKYFELFLKTGQKADAVACNNDDMALGIVNACENNNISLDSVPVIGVDATEKGCKSIGRRKNGIHNISVRFRSGRISYKSRNQTCTW